MERVALVVGASRGLGFVLAGELARRGWRVIATTRGSDEGLVGVEVESLEMTSAGEVAGLRARLAGRRLDLVFVNAAIDRGDVPISEVSEEVFTEVMVTNALSPLRVLEAFRDLVVPGGTVAVMSSDQGSVSLNVEPGYELYKASKAALNQLMRSYATRHAGDGQTKLLIDPGHNRTALGGPGASLEPRDSVPAIVDVLEARKGALGLRFLNLHGETVPW
ncbi:SDR family NAD(P)-dependent oxidoreductase [Actinokineospora auranticolor]|uniref:NAD(P)-dependent dehydrogenase (Short-subunit alcohol dehydrogenase family) n=1 Tax=Actinokineospora auranticolor TaxID=155976 RepID=A0A2S6GNZ6_9PSEU|nr:SDR family NAD(P)-dependent oxidoreductase [Actinokineospora auranticolor]PPK66851.1 NAD(P)-dependent dehydrogenase (short-subunit alcohol dehydrogenase family) [Actinokineospora auranticolor]